MNVLLVDGAFADAVPGARVDHGGAAAALARVHAGAGRGERLQPALRTEGGGAPGGDVPRPLPRRERVTVRDPETSRAFAATLAGILSGELAAEETR